MLAPAGEARWIIADGHHRVAAARLLASETGRPVHLAAVETTASIEPAHRIIHRAPAEWTSRHAGLIDAYERAGPEALATIWETYGLAHPGIEWSIEANRERALAHLANGAAAVILMPQLTLADVRAAALSGRLLPPRSTNFQPKPVEGSIRFAIRP